MTYHFHSHCNPKINLLRTGDIFTSVLPTFKKGLAAQRTKALHQSARGVTTDLGSIPGCVTTVRDWESDRVVHNWPSVIWVRGGFGQGDFTWLIVLLWWAGYMQADVGHQLNDVWGGRVA